MKDRKNVLAVGALAIVSTLTRLLSFGHPASVVFDETYFLKFIGYYWNGTYFFDVHPPLGKLLFVAFAYLTGITPTADIGSIGTAIDPSLVFFRLLPIISGIALPIIIYFICRNLNLSRFISFTAGVFICLENSLILQSRLVLIDTLLLAFGFLSLLFYLQYRNKRVYFSTGRVYLFLSALSFACTVGTKWNGLFFAAPIIAFEIYDLFQTRTTVLKRIWRFISHGLLYAGAGILLYMSFFAIHFSLLPRSGPGDAFMSQGFQKTLVNSKFATTTGIVEPLFFSKFFELNVEMFRAHTRMTSTHTYSSPFYSWPLMTRPIYYWYQAETPVPDTHSRMYLLGNPVLYWGGIFAVVALLLYVLVAACTSSLGRIKNKKALAFILIAFVGTFMPFIAIGRVMFLYHYGAALICSIMALAYLLDLTPSPKQKIRLTLLVVFLALLTFYYISPLTYGLPLTEPQYESRIWFKSWK